MEDTVSASVERTTGEDEDPKTDDMVLNSSKPLHRFVQNQPRTIGVVILMFGCAEVLMGFVLAGDYRRSSFKIYVPFWQGILFLTSGVLSIYTEIHPSKKMVTICLAMYVFSLLGIIVSIIYRIILCMAFNLMAELLCVECTLLVSSLCVSGFLIFLIIIARFALKSTQSQVIVQHIVMQPQNEITSN